MNWNDRLPNVPRGWKNDRVHFCKYMSATTAQIVLENRTLRWSTPGTLNDPYDMQFDLQANVDPQRLQQLAVDNMWEIMNGLRAPIRRSPVTDALQRLGAHLPKSYDKACLAADFSDAIVEGLERVLGSLPDVNEQTRRHMARSKVLCLSEDPTISPMWAHYADLNRGVVLRFRSIPFLDSAFGMAQPIQYLEEVPTLLNEDILAGFYAGEEIDVQQAISNLVLTKGLHWAYEKEWRIHSGSGRDAEAPYEDISFHDLELDGLIFGQNIIYNSRKEISLLLKKYSNVHIFRAVKSPHAFSHEIHDL